MPSDLVTVSVCESDQVFCLLLCEQMQNNAATLLTSTHTVIGFLLSNEDMQQSELTCTNAMD